MLSSRVLAFFSAIFSFLSLAGQISGPNQLDWDLEYANPNLILEQNSAIDSLAMWEEKIVLHLDKNYAKPKESLFFKAYILTGPNQYRVSMSDVLKVDLLDEKGNLIAKQYHKINQGASEGHITIPKNTRDGNYILRAYTQWMLNYGPNQFSSHKVRVNKKTKGFVSEELARPEIAVHIEGGNLLKNIENRLIITGENLNLDDAVVVDEEGTVITRVQDFGDDLGTVLLNPSKDQNYYLKLKTGHKELLPSSVDLGYTVQVNNLDDEKLFVRLAATPGLESQELFLIGSSRGTELFRLPIGFNDGVITEIEIPKEKLKAGLMNLQLIDGFDQKWATRPVFISRNDLNIVLEQSEDTNDTFLVKVTDNEGNPVQTDVSIGVVSQEGKSKRKNGIDKALLFNQSRIERFKSDMLLVANARLQGIGLSNQELPDDIYYDFQKGLDFFGQAYDLGGKLLAGKQISVLINTNEDADLRTVTTDDNGMFKLSGLTINGEADMVFRTEGEDTKEKLVRVVPFDYEVPPLELNESNWRDTNENRPFAPPKFTEFKADGLITLEDVTVTENKLEKRSAPPVYGIKAESRNVVVQDPDKPKLLSELFNQLPNFSTGADGFSVGISSNRPMSSVGSTPNLFGSILDQGGPLWVVDGFNYGNSPVLDPTWGITANDIDRIEFLTPFDANASMWGSRGSYGVVLLYTRNGSENEFFRRKDGQLTFTGFQQPLDFESYRNNLGDNKDGQTLYWNPSLKTNADGEVQVSLKGGKEGLPKRISVTAVTQDGKIASTDKTFLNSQQKSE